MLTIILSFYCLVNANFCWSGTEHSIVGCIERRNVTIIPHFVSIFNSHSMKWSNVITRPIIIQLKYLVKTLFETSCINIYIYSNIRKRCIRQSMENYIHFLETEVQTDSTKYQNMEPIISALSGIPSKSVDGEKQTLLFLNYFRVPGRQSILFNALQETQKLKEYDVILWCAYFSPLCIENAEWLPRKKNMIVFYEMGIWEGENENGFNPNLHQIFLDLIFNPQFNWHSRYIQDVKIKKCQSPQKTYVFLWSMTDIKPLTIDFMVLFVYRYFSIQPNVTVFEGGVKVDRETVMAEFF